MSTQDKAKNAAEKATGKIKEQLGKATDDKSLEAEGQSDQAKGNLKDAGERSKTPSKGNAASSSSGCEPQPQSFRRSVGTMWISRSSSRRRASYHCVVRMPGRSSGP
jgi:uncharacterized protein YjbJ (UPF0337 family)